MLTIRHDSVIRCATTLDRLEAVIEGEPIYLAALWTHCQLQRVGEWVEVCYNSGTSWKRMRMPIDWFQFAVTGLSGHLEVSSA